MINTEVLESRHPLSSKFISSNWSVILQLIPLLSGVLLMSSSITTRKTDKVRIHSYSSIVMILILWTFNENEQREAMSLVMVLYSRLRKSKPKWFWGVRTYLTKMGLKEEDTTDRRNFRNELKSSRQKEPVKKIIPYTEEQEK